MLFLVLNGEGKENEIYNENLRDNLQNLLNEHFKSNPTCVKLRKGKKGICGLQSLSGSCYCHEHYTEERKEFTRKFYLDHNIYIPESRPILNEIEEKIINKESWEHFSEILTRDNTSVLNCLSLYIRMNENINLSSMEQITNLLYDNSLTSAFGNENVVEFIVQFENGNEIQNASVKVWQDLKIQIVGCRTIQTALRVASSVIRVLHKKQILQQILIESIEPVFANASFYFFPKNIQINKLQSYLFIECLRQRIQDTPQLEVDYQVDASKPENSVFAKFCFRYQTLKTITITIYHKGNIMVTCNNFDGLFLQKSLQVLQRVIEEKNLFLENEITPIVIENEQTFLFSPKSNKNIQTLTIETNGTPMNSMNSLNSLNSTRSSVISSVPSTTSSSSSISTPSFKRFKFF